MKGGIAAIVGLLLVTQLTGVAAANSVPTEVALDSNALFITEVDPVTSTINIQASVKCAGMGTIRVQVTQDSPPAATPGGAAGNGELVFTCSGGSQRVAVTIDITEGVFQPGQADAKAQLTAVQMGWWPDTDTDWKDITIRFR